MINGEPVKLAGVCRHDQWFDKGYSLTEECWRRDLELMKDANINSIRTAHYNHDPRFLKLCDEMGFYLLDESPGCWCEPKDPSITVPWLLRMRETWQRDRNRPSVVIWSLGNESEGGIANMETLKWITRTDPTRPAFASQIVFWQKYGQDIEDYHYPLQSQLIQRRDDRGRKGPIIQTEQPHMWCIDGRTRHDWGLKDFWGVALKEVWDITWANDAFIGAHIWQWADTQIPDPGGNTIRPEPGMTSALVGLDAEYGMDNLFKGKKPATVYGNTKGLVNANRTLIKPEFWHVKMTYSPVVVGTGSFDAASREAEVAIANRYSFTDLSELTCQWEALAAGKILAAGKQAVSCPPRSATRTRFPVTPGMDTLRLEFTDGQGRMVYAARINRAGFVPVAPTPIPETRGDVSCVEKDGQLHIGMGKSELVLDKRTGRLCLWKSATVEIPVNGPVLTLGESIAPRGGYVMSSGDIELRQIKVQVAEANGAPVVTVRGNVYVARGNTPIGVFTYILQPQRDGNVALDWSLEWKGADLKAWEAGVKFLMPGTFNALSWARQGQWSEYPADHVGALDGSVRHGEISFQSVKRDAYWAALSGDKAIGLALVRGDSTLHARSYLENGITTFYALSALGTPPVGCWANILSATHDISLKPSVVLRGALTLRLVNIQK